MNLAYVNTYIFIPHQNLYEKVIAPKAEFHINNSLNHGVNRPRPKIFQPMTEWPTIRTSILGCIDFVHAILSIIPSKSCFLEIDFS